MTTVVLVSPVSGTRSGSSASDGTVYPPRSRRSTLDQAAEPAGENRQRERDEEAEQHREPW